MLSKDSERGYWYSRGYVIARFKVRERAQMTVEAKSRKDTVLILFSLEKGVFFRAQMRQEVSFKK